MRFVVLQFRVSGSFWGFGVKTVGARALEALESPCVITQYLLGRTQWLETLNTEMISFRFS